MSVAVSCSICEEDTFIGRFRPIINNINPNASFDFGCGDCIWTLIDEDGVLLAGSGLRFVNRLGYFISRMPVEGGEMLSFCLDTGAQEEPDEGITTPPK